MNARTLFLEELGDGETRRSFVRANNRHRIALLIRNLREQRGFEQTDLVAAMGRSRGSQSQISRLESREGSLNINTVIDAFDALGLTLFIDAIPLSRFLSESEEMSVRRLSAESIESPIEKRRLKQWAMQGQFPWSRPQMAAARWRDGNKADDTSELPARAIKKPAQKIKDTFCVSMADVSAYPVVWKDED